MSEHRQRGVRLVDAAEPSFKDFRVDFEKISNAASKMCREQGSDEIAALMFVDRDWDIRMPLQRRYVEHGATDDRAWLDEIRGEIWNERRA